MKRIFALILCIVMVGYTFAGCASKEPEDLFGEPQGTFESEYLEALEKQMSSASIKYDISQVDENTLLFNATRNVSLTDYESSDHEYDNAACKTMLYAILDDMKSLNSLTGIFVLKNASGEKLTEKTFAIKRYNPDNIYTLKDLDEAGIFALLTVEGQKNSSGVLALLGNLMTIIVKCVDEDSMVIEMQIKGVSGEYMDEEHIASLHSALNKYLEQYEEKIRTTCLDPLKNVNSIDVTMCLLNNNKTVITSAQKVLEK